METSLVNKQSLWTKVAKQSLATALAVVCGIGAFYFLCSASGLGLFTCIGVGAIALQYA